MNPLKTLLPGMLVLLLTSLALGEERKAGDKMTITIAKRNGVDTKMAFRWCPPGTFMMGSPEDEEGRSSTETQHEVTLTKGFWIAETEVTQNQWQAVMGNNPSDFDESGLDASVEQVSWDDASKFCKETGLRLPTEAEWEYACRAGTKTAFSFGKRRLKFSFGKAERRLKKYAWFGQYSDDKTHPVGQKKPNPWGIHDMHGNVAEWCQDWCAPADGEVLPAGYPEGPVTDPTGPEKAEYRVVRGGSWLNDAKDCRSASRNDWDPDYRDDGYLGFRPVRSAD